jgi:hypothetical protein
VLLVGGADAERFEGVEEEDDADGLAQVWLEAFAQIFGEPVEQLVADLLGGHGAKGGDDLVARVAEARSELVDENVNAGQGCGPNDFGGDLRGSAYHAAAAVSRLFGDALLVAEHGEGEVKAGLLGADLGADFV